MGLKKKKEDFNLMINVFKKDYYKLCSCFEKNNSKKCSEIKFKTINELNLESPFFKTYIESCNNLTKMQQIKDRKDETYLSLSDEQKTRVKKTKFKAVKLKGESSVTSRIWWDNLNELIIENNSKLKKIKRSLDNY